MFALNRIKIRVKLKSLSSKGLFLHHGTARKAGVFSEGGEVIFTLIARDDIK